MAGVQGRDGAPEPLAGVPSLCPWLRHILADGGHNGDKLKAALKGLGDWAIKIVKRSDAAPGLALPPCR